MAKTTAVIDALGKATYYTFEGSYVTRLVDATGRESTCYAGHGSVCRSR